MDVNGMFWPFSLLDLIMQTWQLSSKLLAHEVDVTMMLGSYSVKASQQQQQQKPLH